MLNDPAWIQPAPETLSPGHGTLPTRSDHGRGYRGLGLNWGDAELIENLLLLIVERRGFTIPADSGKAVTRGKYPAAARLLYGLKGVIKSDPHDARIMKAFALGWRGYTRHGSSAKPGDTRNQCQHQ